MPEPTPSTPSTLMQAPALLIAALALALVAGAIPAMTMLGGDQGATPGAELSTQTTSTNSLEATLQHLGPQAYEPTLAITPEGNLFYVAGTPGYTVPPLYLTGQPGQMWVYGSFDDGATWTNVTPDTDQGEIIDPYLIADQDTGRLFRAAYQASSVGGNDCIDLVWSDDQGETWEHQPRACGIPPALHDHESLATGTPRNDLLAMDGYPNVLYMCVNQLHATGCTTSRDGGESFGPTVPVFESVNAGGWCGGLNGPVVTDSEGRAFVPRIHCGEAKLAVSEDDGLTWQRHTIDTDHPPRDDPLLTVGGADVPYIDTQDVMLAIDDQDNLYAAWVAADGMIWVGSSQDHGQTWSPAWQVDVPEVTAVAGGQFSIAAGAPGHLAFAFLATDHPGGYEENQDPEDWEGATWDAHLAVTEDGLEPEPSVASVQVNPDSDPLGVDDCGFHRCTPCPAQDCGGWFDYIDVDLDADGRPWAALVDVCHETCHQTGELDKAVATVATLTAGPSLTTPGQPLPALDGLGGIVDENQTDEQNEETHQGQPQLLVGDR